MSQSNLRTSRPLCSLALSLLLLTALAACGGGGSGNSGTGAPGSSSSGGGGTPPPTSGSASLSWTAPTTNTNGSALTNLSGYTIIYGTSPSALNQSVAINNASAASYTINGLAAGTWYFSVVANSNDGSQSAPTAPVSLTIA